MALTQEREWVVDGKPVGRQAARSVTGLNAVDADRVSSTAVPFAARDAGEVLRLAVDGAGRFVAVGDTPRWGHYVIRSVRDGEARLAAIDGPWLIPGQTGGHGCLGGSLK